MASRLRNKTARVSFLAFQDMISTVTGVLMIVMILLSLDVNTSAPRANEAARDAVRERLIEARHQLEIDTEMLRQRQAELAALQHRIFVIPEADPSGKEPVLIVLSATNGCCSRLNQANLVEFSAREADFRRLLQTWDASRMSLVFYVRPSGVRHFEQCYKLAKLARPHFQIGSDAAEEEGQYVLLKQ